MVVLALTVAVAGCASGGPIALAGEDGKDPAQVIRDAQAALHHARGVSVHFTGTSGGTSVDVNMSGDGKSNVHGTGRFGSIPIEFEVSSGTLYVKGSDFFLKGPGASATDAQKAQFKALVGDRWVSLGAATAAAGFADLSKLADPAVLADCLDDHGTLGKGGTDTVNTLKAVVVTEKGDAPGDAAGKIYVAIDGPHYPLRLVQFGAVAPGTGKVYGKCPASGSAAASSTRQDLTIDFSGFDSVTVIATPDNPVDLSKLLTGG